MAITKALTSSPTTPRTESAPQTYIGTATSAGVLAFLLYVWGLAPTVLWGDSAELQRAAWLGDPFDAPRGHFLWIWSARTFSHIVLGGGGDAAYRASLVTAVFAAIGVALAALCVRASGGNRFGMIAGASALALSHTYWLHAVQAEVYSLHCMLLLGAVLSFLHWIRRRDRAELLFLSFFICGIALLNHTLILVALPSFALVTLLVARPRWRSLLVALAGLGFGLLPLAFVLARSHSTGTIPSPVLDPWGATPRRLGLTVAYYAIQFPALIPLPFLGLTHMFRKYRAMGGLLVLQIAMTAAAVTCLNVKDYYVFHQPAYVCLAILVGVGASALSRNRRTMKWVIAAGVAASPLVYFAAAKYATSSGVHSFDVRVVPGRNASYFLWPPKSECIAARDFAANALEGTEQNSLILADWTLAQPMLYLQQVEGLRSDVRIVMTFGSPPEQTAYMLKRSEHQPVYVAAIDRYYGRAELETVFEIRPAGPIYRLNRRP